MITLELYAENLHVTNVQLSRNTQYQRKALREAARGSENATYADIVAEASRTDMRRADAAATLKHINESISAIRTTRRETLSSVGNFLQVFYDTPTDTANNSETSFS